MEKVPGVKLTTVWDAMHSQKKLEVVQQLVQYEKAFATSRFPAYGGLYYAKDVQNGGVPTTYEYNQAIPERRFVIDPTNNRKYFDDERGQLSLDRGPCEFLFGIGFLSNTANSWPREFELRIR